MYDAYLGGTANFEADRQAVQRIVELVPEIRDAAWANRGFLQRAVHWMAERGIRQFIDLGAGLPTQRSTHEVARATIADARVVYTDIDPGVIAHGHEILAGVPGAALIEADFRQPADVLDHRDVRALIDFTQPVGLLIVAVTQFIADADDPWRVVATLRDALAPGSYLVLGHATDESSKPAVAQAAEKVYNRSVSTRIHVRSRAEILRFFDGFDLVEPGLVSPPLWRPDTPSGLSDPSQVWGLAGVARKP